MKENNNKNRPKYEPLEGTSLIPSNAFQLMIDRKGLTIKDETSETTVP